MSELYGLFMGIGVMAVFLVASYLLYQISRNYKTSADKELRYAVFEELILNDMAKEKGYDLELEILKRTRTKDIRKKLEEDAYNKMFGEGTSKEKKK